jgi:DNA-binding SARP family transcriptional activator
VSSEIAIRLLGPLEVELAGRRVRFEGVKQRKLFMVMAAAVLALPHRPKEAG